MKVSKIEEAILILQEECAEVIHIANKALRFGLLDTHPEANKTNKELLAMEIGDVLAMVEILIKNKVVNSTDLEIAKKNKLEKLKKWSKLFETNIEDQVDSQFLISVLKVIEGSDLGEVLIDGQWIPVYKICRAALKGKEPHTCLEKR